MRVSNWSASVLLVFRCWTKQHWWSFGQVSLASLWLFSGELDRAQKVTLFRKKHYLVKTDRFEKWMRAYLRFNSFSVKVYILWFCSSFEQICKKWFSDRQTQGGLTQISCANIYCSWLTKFFFRSAVRLCCPQGGVFTNVLTFLFEVFIMAPCLACKWASGKGKQPPNWTTGSKPRYGGTDDVELGDKWPLIARTKYLNISRLTCTVLFLAKYLFLGLWLCILGCWNCDASSSLIDFWREKRDFREHRSAGLRSLWARTS